MILGVVASSIDKGTAVLTDSLIAYWGFNNDANDSLGVHDGTTTSVTYDTGKSGLASHTADATNAGTTVSSSTDFTFGNGTTDQPFSISMYVNFDVMISTTDGGLVGRRQLSLTNLEYQLMVYNGDLIFALFGNGDGNKWIQRVYTINGVISTGTWYHIIATYDGSGDATGLNIYIDDGSSVGTASDSGDYVAMSQSTADLTISKLEYNTLFSIDGLVDGVAIWDKELTSADRTEIYDIQNGGDEVVYDVETKTFNEAVGTLITTEEDAIQDLVVGLKTNGTWSKYNAIYPIIGGTEAEHKWNLKDPRDLDAAFRLTFYNGSGTRGGFLHDANGMEGDDSNDAGAWAQTHFTTSGNWTDSGTYVDGMMGYYSNLSKAGNTTGDTELGVDTAISDWLRTNLQIEDSGGMFGALCSSFVNRGTTSTTKYAQMNSVSGTLTFYEDGVVQGTTITQNTSANLSTTPFAINAATLTTAGTTSDRTSSRRCAFVTIGEGFTATEISDDYDTIQAYQTTLSRQV